MTAGSFSNAEDCSLKNVTMNDLRWNPAVFVRCDFSGAKLNIDTGIYRQPKSASSRKPI